VLRHQPLFYNSPKGWNNGYFASFQNLTAPGWAGVAKGIFMAKVFESSVIPAPVDKVWELVRNFNGLPEWHPAIKKRNRG
jgi:hypothetical protein